MESPTVKSKPCKDKVQVPSRKICCAFQKKAKWVCATSNSAAGKKEERSRKTSPLFIVHSSLSEWEMWEAEYFWPTYCTSESCENCDRQAKNEQGHFESHESSELIFHLTHAKRQIGLLFKGSGQAFHTSCCLSTSCYPFDRLTFFACLSVCPVLVHPCPSLYVRALPPQLRVFSSAVWHQWHHPAYEKIK